MAILVDTQQPAEPGANQTQEIVGGMDGWLYYLSILTVMYCIMQLSQTNVSRYERVVVHKAKAAFMNF